MSEAAAALAEAEAQLAAREAEAQAAETALAAARETERRARAPYEAAERNLGALQAEARTLAELLDLEKTKRFPPLIDSLEVVARLRAGAGRRARRRSRRLARPGGAGLLGRFAAPTSSIAPLPEGAEPLSDFVEGPGEPGAAAPPDRRGRGRCGATSLQPTLSAGQRLVTRDGGLWRWDGLRAQPGSATAGARRLEQRNRVAFAGAGAEERARQPSTRRRDCSRRRGRCAPTPSGSSADSRGAVREARRTLGCPPRGARRRRSAGPAASPSGFRPSPARWRASRRTPRRRAASCGRPGRRSKALPDTTALTARRDDAAGAARRASAARRPRRGWRRRRRRTRRSMRVPPLGRACGRARALGVARRARRGAHGGAAGARWPALDADIAALADDPGAFEERRRSADERDRRGGSRRRPRRRTRSPSPRRSTAAPRRRRARRSKP